MLKVAIAHSLELDSQDAIKELLEQCHEQLVDIMPQAGILFAGIDHDFELILDRINKVYPKIELIGGTTAGELSSVHGFADDSIVLTLFCSDVLYFKAGIADGVSKNPIGSLKKAAEKAKSSLDQEPKLCIAIPSGLTTSGDLVVEGLSKGLGEAFPIFGGTAGEQWRFEGKTYQFYNNKVFTDAAPFLLLGGPLLYSFGVETGWIPIGKKARVTKSDNNVVYEIDDVIALDFYKHHLGEDIGVGSEGAISEYPLAVYEEDKENFYLRAPIILDRENGSLTFVGNVPEGSTIQITHTTRDKIIEASKKAINSSVADYPGSNSAAALCFSCVARKQVLGTRVGEEYLAFKNNFPELPVIGFYTYGEMGPLGRDKPARFHNETFFNLLIGVE